MPRNLRYHRSDLGNAEFFASLYKGKVKYDHLRGKWFLWNGIRWREDNKGDINILAHKAIRERRKRSDRITNPEQKEKEVKWALRSESKASLQNMLEIAAKLTDLKTSGKYWDLDPYLLGTLSGIIDLRTGQRIKAEPSQMVTMSVAVKHDPKAVSRLWVDTISSFWPDDPEMIHFIHKAVGYAFTGEIKEQALFCLFGAGSNGKSVFQNTLVRLAGDYGYVAPFSTLEFHERAGISNDVAILQGKRFVTASETQENIRINEGRIKSLTGDSNITARFLYQEPFTFRPVAKFFIGFNHKPRVVDDTHGFWRRIRLLTFGRIFSEEEQDKELENKLAKEFSGILNWIIEGCLLWMQEGLEPPVRVIADTFDYRVESNPLNDFVEECLARADGARTTNQEMWDEYNAWAKRNGEKFLLGRKSFKQRLEALSFKSGEFGKSNTRVWFDVKLRTNAGQPLDVEV